MTAHRKRKLGMLRFVDKAMETQVLITISIDLFGYQNMD